MSQSELSETSVAEEERENLVSDWEDNPEVVVSKLYKKIESIEEKLDSAVGGTQPSPDDQITVWDEKHDPPEKIYPGSQEVAGILGELRGRRRENGYNTNQVDRKLKNLGSERSRQRVTDLMRDIAEQHPHVVVMEDCKPMRLHWDK